MQLNMQPAEGMNYQTDGSVDVVDVFYTIQGEGPFAGTPAVFVRTAGCNLSRNCKLCDTDYTNNRKRYLPGALLDRVKEVLHRHGGSEKKCRLIVLTGGEPFRQAVLPFVKKAWEQGFHIQVETNGTYSPFRNDEVNDFSSMWDAGLTIVCSPKTPYIHADIKKFADCFKYVIRAGFVDPKDGLPMEALGSDKPPARPSEEDGYHFFLGESPIIYVQPADEQDPEKNAANIKAAVQSCLDFGYKISLQTHKLLNLP